MIGVIKFYQSLFYLKMLINIICLQEDKHWFSFQYIVKFSHNMVQDKNTNSNFFQLQMPQW